MFINLRKQFPGQGEYFMSLIGRILKKNAENENLQLCDLHCHLLPYVDDGATDMEEACAMLKSEDAQ